MRKYEKTTFNIKGPFTTNDESGIDESKAFVVDMKHYETIRNILKTFGDLIRSLSITFNYIMDESKAREIVGDISNNCTQSLLQIEFNNCYGTVLQKLNNYYPNVYILSFSTDKYRDLKTNGSLNLSKVFFRVNQLQLQISNPIDWNVVGEKFRHLTSLTVDLPSNSDPPDVGNLFANSPNINSLDISFSSLDILQAASVFLLNLRRLVLRGFSDYPYIGRRIHFENVTFLDLISMICDSELIPKILVFHQIQHLKLNLPDFTDNWSKFFTNQQGKTIEYFDIKADSFTNEQLTAIADSQPNIKWTKLVSRTQIPTNAIVNFIKKSSQLFRCQISCRLNDIAERDLLEEQLETDWNIEFYYTSLNALDISMMR